MTMRATEWKKTSSKHVCFLSITMPAQSALQQVGSQVARAGGLIYMEMHDEARAHISAIWGVAPQYRTLPELQRDLQVCGLKGGGND